MLTHYECMDATDTHTHTYISTPIHPHTTPTNNSARAASSPSPPWPASRAGTRSAAPTPPPSTPWRSSPPRSARSSAPGGSRHVRILWVFAWVCVCAERLRSANQLIVRSSDRPTYLILHNQPYTPHTQVSTINPGFHRTEMNNVAVQGLEACWAKVPEPVKAQYGDKCVVVLWWCLCVGLVVVVFWVRWDWLEAGMILMSVYGWRRSSPCDLSITHLSPPSPRPPTQVLRGLPRVREAAHGGDGLRPRQRHPGAFLTLIIESSG